MIGLSYCQNCIYFLGLNNNMMYCKAFNEFIPPKIALREVEYIKCNDRYKFVKKNDLNNV